MEGKNVAITDTSQIDAFYDELYRYPWSVIIGKPEIRLAIRDLYNIIHKCPDMCFQEGTHLISRFLSSHINGKCKIPTSLKNFFIGLAMRTSKIYHQRLVQELVTHSSKLITDTDFEHSERHVIQIKMIAISLNHTISY